MKRFTPTALAIAGIALSLALLPAGCPNTGGGDGGSGAVGIPIDDADLPAPITNLSVSPIVSRGDSVPDQDGATFTFFGPPIIDSEGRIAFWAAYDGPESGSGIYIWFAGTLTRVIDTDPDRAGEIPGRDEADAEFFAPTPILLNSGALPLAWGSDGRLLFVATIAPEGSQALFRYRVSDGNLLLVVDRDDIADQFADAQAAAFSGTISSPGLSDGGVASFVVTYTYITVGGGFVTGEEALFTSDGTTLTRVADSNPMDLVDVPDRSSNAAFAAVDPRATLNPDGAIVFQAQYAGRSNEGTRGVYLRFNGQTLRVVDDRSDGTFPGFPLGSVVNPTGGRFEAISIGDQLRVVIETTVTTPTGTRETVLYWDGATFAELGFGNLIATALLSGMNDRGQVVYLVDGRPFIAGTSETDLTDGAPGALLSDDVTWLPTGNGLNNNGRVLLRYTREDPTFPGLAVWTGDRLEVVVDDDLNITPDLFDIVTVGSVEQDRPGRSGAINDSDDFTFRGSQVGPDDLIGTDDDIQAIYRGDGS